MCLFVQIHRRSSEMKCAKYFIIYFPLLQKLKSADCSNFLIQIPLECFLFSDHFIFIRLLSEIERSIHTQFYKVMPCLSNNENRRSLSPFVQKLLNMKSTPLTSDADTPNIPDTPNTPNGLHTRNVLHTPNTLNTPVP